MAERCEIERLEGGAARGEGDGVYGDDAVGQERPHADEDDSDNESVYQDEEAKSRGREADVSVVQVFGEGRAPGHGMSTYEHDYIRVTQGIVRRDLASVMKRRGEAEIDISHGFF